MSSESSPPAWSKRPGASKTSRGAHLRGSGSGVGVEAATGLAPELAGHHHLPKLAGRHAARLPALLVKALQHRQAGVQADQVQELERAHREAASTLHGGVDVLLGGD